MRRHAYLTLALLLGLPAAGRPQWTDAELPARGELQIGLGAQNNQVERMLGADGESRPLSEMLAVDLNVLQSAELEELDDVLSDLFAALGLAAPAASQLGQLGHDVLRERIELPLSLTLGLTDWLAVRAEVPIVRGKSFVAAAYDTLAAGAGLGSSAFNGDAEGTLGALAVGIEQLDAIVAADTLSAERRAEAEALLAEARALESGLQSLRSLQFMPTDSSAAGRELLAFYENLRLGFSDFSVALPAIALAQPLSPGGAAALAAGPEFGIETPAGRNTGFRFGDVELGLSLQPINTFRSRSDRRDTLLRLRARLDGVVRFPSGRTAAANHISEVGAGDGQLDVELGTALDVALGNRFWLSLLGRYNIQTEARTRRLITMPESPIQPGAITAPVLWDPGDVITVTALPRFNLTRALTLGLSYTHSHHARDRVRPTKSGASEDGAFAAADLERGTEFTARSLGFALRYSATDWSGDRRVGLPVEAELRYRKTLSASDGLAPQEGVWQVGIRLYERLWR